MANRLASWFGIHSAMIKPILYCILSFLALKKLKALFMTCSVVCWTEPLSMPVLIYMMYAWNVLSCAKRYAFRMHLSISSSSTSCPLFFNATLLSIMYLLNKSMLLFTTLIWTSKVARLLWYMCMIHKDLEEHHCRCVSTLLIHMISLWLTSDFFPSLFWQWHHDACAAHHVVLGTSRALGRHIGKCILANIVNWD